MGTAEGCATFYKTTRFKRVDKQVVDYDKLCEKELNRDRVGVPPSQDSDKGLLRLSKGNIALSVTLEDLHIKATHSSQAAGPNGGHALCVVDTDHADLRADPAGVLKNLSMGHAMRMATAYETCNGQEAPYTNYTEDFKGTLDYIWFSSDTLVVLAISQVDDESQLTQETALPSSTRPSDHVSLVATFMFRDAVDSQPSQQAVGRSLVANGNGPNPYQTVGNALMNPASSHNSDNILMNAQWASSAQYQSRSYSSPWN